MHWFEEWSSYDNITSQVYYWFNHAMNNENNENNLAKSCKTVLTKQKNIPCLQEFLSSFLGHTVVSTGLGGSCGHATGCPRTGAPTPNTSLFLEPLSALSLWGEHWDWFKKICKLSFFSYVLMSWGLPLSVLSSSKNRHRTIQIFDLMSWFM